MLFFEKVLDWALGCECCLQFELEKHRHRPSNVRTSLFDFILGAAFVEPSIRSQLKRALTDYVKLDLIQPLKPKRCGKMVVYSNCSLRLSFSVPLNPVFSHIETKRLDDPPFFTCEWADSSLVDAFDADQLISDFKSREWIVSDGFRVVLQLGKASPYEWEFEYAALFGGKDQKELFDSFSPSPLAFRLSCDV